MKCVVCGKKAGEKDRKPLLIGEACSDCVPRGLSVPFQIRQASSPEDTSFILSFLDELFGETEFIEFGRWYRVAEMEKLVAVAEDGEYIGFAVYTQEESETGLMTLLTVNVAEPFVRRGVGSELLEGVKKKAREAGVGQIRVPISNDDLLSYVFYHRNGFRLSGIDLELCVKRHGEEVEGFWQLPLRDELYLVCDLRDGAG